MSTHHIREQGEIPDLSPMVLRFETAATILEPWPLWETTDLSTRGKSLSTLLLLKTSELLNLVLPQVDHQSFRSESSKEMAADMTSIVTP